MSRFQVSKLAKKFVNRIQHHSELPIRLEKYLKFYQGFDNKKISELIESQSAIQIYNERISQIVSESPSNSSAAPTNETHRHAHATEAQQSLSFFASDSLKRKVSYNSLIYPFERVIINNEKLPKPTLKYHLLYKPTGMRSEILPSPDSNSKPTKKNKKYDCITEWLLALDDEQEQEQHTHKPKMSYHLCGRLDKSSSGLLLSTNDGTLISLLTSPTMNTSRVYRCNISRNHWQTKFRSMKLLQSQGTLLKQNIGRVSAESVTPRGRIDTIESFYASKKKERMKLLKTDGMIDDVDYEVEGDDANADASAEERQQSFLESLLDLEENDMESESESDVHETRTHATQTRNAIPLKSSGEHTGGDANHKAPKTAEERRKDKIAKYQREYWLSTERQTQWDVCIKTGGRHILQKMIGSLGFECHDIERVGYSCLSIDDEPLKSWYIQNQPHLIRNVNALEFESIDSYLQSLLDYNTLELNHKQRKQLWESVGGLNIAITMRLQSLLERAQRMQDLEFYHFLKQEYGIEI